MESIINGLRYSTAKATPAARDISGIFEARTLYLTPAGRFFVHVVPSDRIYGPDRIEPLTREQAKQEYRDAPEHLTPYETVFGETIEDA
ncbi:MAG: hypothetical protein PHP55_05055 [Methanoculleus sp.]|nr:hypothetical protein [Methanoculleus sp.]